MGYSQDKLKREKKAHFRLQFVAKKGHLLELPNVYSRTVNVSRHESGSKLGSQLWTSLNGISLLNW